jgi:hypothetical protein
VNELDATGFDAIARDAGATYELANGRSATFDDARFASIRLGRHNECNVIETSSA